MKRFLLPALLLIVGSAAPAWAWEILSFDADLTVQADGALLVTETIEADFQGEAKHGIYRDIPLQTQDRLGIKRSIRITFLEALDEQGRPWEAKLTREGAYRRIRLGSEGVTTNGRKTFKLSYRVERALGQFPDHDELYWNVTGNNWAVPIRQARAVVRLPEAVSGPPRSVAYTGAYGSTGQDVMITTAGSNALQFSVSRPLGPFEGLTVVVGWPSGAVAMPGRAQKFRWFFRDNWPLAIPLGVLLLMTWIWWNFGRDPTRQSTPVQYEPPEGLMPAEVGALSDDNVDLKDITATIVDLARRGFLTIEELKDKEYIFTRRKPAAGGANPTEELLLKFLFFDGETVRLSDLENQFYQHLPGLRTALYDGLVKRGCWWSRPDRVKVFWWGVAGSVFFLGMFGMGALPDPGIPFAALCLSSVIIFVFSWFMPRKTWHGARLAEKVAGFQEFLRRTDKDRIKRDPNPAVLFERMLPYAMALGVANQWAKVFEGVYQISPSWYISAHGGFFTPGDFTRRLNSASSRMGSSLASTPRSSGGSGFSGGFSGGGGGGGGGGSW
ncbi:MAG: DUF2207 domain-containing protein [Candidatus Omnitrophota bacterium]|nr:DUF2207 domain-containing protein [Candidatus Omnitrophota bacterium]